MLRLVPDLQELGWDLSFWTPSPGALRDEIEALGLPCAGEPRLLRYSWRPLRSPPGVLARTRSVPGSLLRFRRWLELQRPDVVHANTLLLLPEAAVARRAGAPVLAHVHEVIEGGRRGAVAARILRATADVVVAPSQCSAAALARAGVPAVSVVHNGVPLPARPAIPNGHVRPVVGTVATISRQKGSDLFLEASRRVRESEPAVEFRMVGPLAPEPDRAWAEGLVAVGREADVRWSTTTDVFDELAGWDVFVLPSRREAFPLVVLEAMAAGLPVVATRVGGIAEQILPGAGILVPPDDPQSLARAILDLVRDPHERVRLGTAARQHVAGALSLKRQAALMDEAYRTSIARAAKR